MKYISDFYQFVNELRSNAELNKKEDIAQEIDKFINFYKDTPELLFLHFSQSVKPSHINKKYTYDFSPMALYLYPMYNPFDKKLDFIENRELKHYLNISSEKNNVEKIFDLLYQRDFFDLKSFQEIDNTDNYNKFSVFLQGMINEYNSTDGLGFDEYRNRMKYTKNLIILEEDGSFYWVDLFDPKYKETKSFNKKEKSDFNLKQVKDFYLKLFYDSLSRNREYKRLFNIIMYFFSSMEEYDQKKVYNILSDNGIKCTLNRVYDYDKAFKYFTYNEYIYLYKLKSLDGILIQEKHTSDDLKPYVKRAAEYIIKRWDIAIDDAYDIFSTTPQLDNFKTEFDVATFYKSIKVRLYSTLIKLNKFIGSKRQNVLFSILKACDIKGIMSYNHNFIDDHINNQLALIDQSLIEEYTYFKNKW